MHRRRDLVARGLDAVAFGALAATMAYAPLAWGSSTDAAATGLRLAMAVVVAATSLSVAAGTPLRWLPAPLSVPWTVLLAAVWVSVPLGRYPSSSVTEALVITGFLTGLPLAYHHARSRWRVTALLTVACATALACVSYGLTQVVGLPISSWGAQRLSSTYRNANAYAGFLDLIVPATFVFALFHARQVVRVLAAAAFLLVASNLVLTFSRGAWVAVASAIVTAVVLGSRLVASRRSGGEGTGPRRRWTRGLGLVAVSVVVIGGFVAGRAPGLGRTVVDRASDLAYVVTNLDRFDRAYIWRAGMDVVLASPWVGVGPGNFVDAIAPYRPQPDPALGVFPFQTRIDYAHNDAIQVAIESGLLAAAAFLTLWSTILATNGRRRDLTDVALRGGLVAIVVHGIVDANLTVVPANAFLAYVVAGIVHARAATAQGSDGASRGLLST